jgi:hypothetical protein
MDSLEKLIDRLGMERAAIRLTKWMFIWFGLTSGDWPESVGRALLVENLQR